MKTICFVNSYACIGGAEKSLQSLIQGFKNRNYNVVAIIGEDGALCDWLSECNISYKIIPQPSLLSGLSRWMFPFHLLNFLVRALYFISCNNVDIVHVNTFRSRLYCACVRPFFRGRMIAHVRDIEISIVNKYMVKFYDYTIAISNAVAKTLTYRGSKIDTEKVKTIYNAVECQAIPSAKKNHGPIHIGMFARFDEWKCQHIFVRAAKKLCETNSNITFHIYGDAIRDSEVEYQNEVLSIVGNDENIICHGFVKDTVSEMLKMDLIVCPSDNEPFGRVIIEAMALKKMVIASNNGGAAEILSDELSGLTFKPRDVNALINSIKIYINNKETQDEYYIPLLDMRYKMKFSLERLLNEVEALYT